MFLPRDGIVVDLNPPVDTAAYATGDLLFVPIEVPNAVLNTKGLAYLRTLLVLDAANQKSAIDLLIFDRDPGSLGTLNNAIDISETQMSYLVALYSVAAADYVTAKATTNAVATKIPNLMLPAKAQSKSFWLAGVSRGSPDYVAATDLRIKLILERQG
jgi:hypothetical protein